MSIYLSLLNNMAIRNIKSNLFSKTLLQIHSFELINCITLKVYFSGCLFNKVKVPFN